MSWTVEFHPLFESEFDGLDELVRDELLAVLQLLETFGPTLGRPRVDKLSGSKHKNMKELRFDAAHGVWRVALAFDPKRNAVLLVGGDKSGTSTARFYRRLIARADGRFDAHLAQIRRHRER